MKECENNENINNRSKWNACKISKSKTKKGNELICTDVSDLDITNAKQ